MASPEDVERNAAKAPADTIPVSTSPATPSSISRGELEHHGVVVVGAVGAPECGVDRREQVEDTEQCQHCERRPAGGPAVGVGVEADHHVRQAHGAQEGREHDGVRRVDALAARTERHRPAAPASLRTGTAVARPHREQHRGGDEQRGELEPVLEGLDEGDAPHPASAHVDHHDEADDQRPDPGRRVDGRGEGQPGALELGKQVEPADRDDQDRAQGPDRARAEPSLGEVGQRIGAAAAQRRSDEHQQHEVAGRPADRVPEHLGAGGEHQRGDPEEGGGGEVLAADRAPVEPGSDAARGDVEVAGGAREAQPVGPDRQCRQADQDECDEARDPVRAHSSSSVAWTIRTKFRSLRSARRT